MGRTAGRVGGVLSARRCRCVDRARVGRRASAASAASCLPPRLMFLRPRGFAAEAEPRQAASF